ncbi:hypothetical protein [uncultured Pedobacter sp.]|uniref:hypothetical protein n=1 Tax=uncultured Pedobacter sp. TaxID=246139 RepID=UPI0025E4CF43|nr:hypothetical protein [uncultured Pedobacter sp.]
MEHKLSKLETTVIITYFSIWLFIYLASRLTFEMTEIKVLSGLVKWVAIGVSPVAIYAALRTGFVEKAKWYGFLGYLLAYGVLLTFATEYMVIQSKLLWSATVKDQAIVQVKVIQVRKVFKRKLGFDHTEVTILRNGNVIKMEARPYAFFYLKDKKQLDMKIGDSDMGEYVTAVNNTLAEKTVARWLHFKDMIHRIRWVIVIIMVTVAAALIKGSYFPDEFGVEKKKMSFWKQMGLVMAILFGIALLFYAGLWIYISFFSTR